MTEEENGTVALHSEQPKPGHIGVNMQINPQGVVLSFPVNLGLDNETMTQLVQAFLQTHPERVQEIAREALAQKQAQLDIIQMVKKSRNE